MKFGPYFRSIDGVMGSLFWGQSVTPIAVLSSGMVFPADTVIHVPDIIGVEIGHEDEGQDQQDQVGDGQQQTNALGDQRFIDRMDHQIHSH